MRFCGTHWEKLRTAINARGLERFVAKDGAAAAGRLKTQIEGGKSDAGTFEPLLGAHFAIMSQALHVAGVALMTPKDDGGEWCPICYMQQACKCGAPECPTRFEAWIDHAADESLQEAKRLGLVAAS